MRRAPLLALALGLALSACTRPQSERAAREELLAKNQALLDAITDAAGRVVDLVDRRDNNDLVWRRDKGNR